MKQSEIAALQASGNSGHLYQLGIPVEKLSTVFMLWCSYDRPCKILITPSLKNEDLAVVEFRHDILASQIVELVKDCMVKIVTDQPNKLVKI